MMHQLTSLASRILFAASFVLAGVAIVEKVANVAGYTLLRGYTAFRLMEWAAMSLIFVIAVQLREIKHAKSIH